MRTADDISELLAFIGDNLDRIPPRRRNHVHKHLDRLAELIRLEAAEGNSYELTDAGRTIRRTRIRINKGETK